MFPFPEHLSFIEHHRYDAEMSFIDATTIIEYPNNPQARSFALVLYLTFPVYQNRQVLCTDREDVLFRAHGNLIDLDLEIPFSFEETFSDHTKYEEWAKILIHKHVIETYVHNHPYVNQLTIECAYVSKEAECISSLCDMLYQMVCDTQASLTVESSFNSYQQLKDLDDRAHRYCYEFLTKEVTK
jgi:hypothetical protein